MSTPPDAADHGTADHSAADNSQERIWAYYQNERPDLFAGANARLDYLLKRIAKAALPQPKILNIGAGSGYLEKKALQRGWHSYSLDPDAVTIAELVKAGVKGEVGYIEKMPFETDAFDFVVASEVFEHLSDQQIHDGIGEIARVLKPGGWFIGTVPYREEIAANTVVCPDCGKIFHRWGHLQVFDEASLRARFHGALVPRVAEARLLQAFAALNWKGKLVALVKQSLFKAGVHGKNENLYFEAQKEAAPR